MELIESEDQYSPREKVGRFITRVWNHPLVDEKTLTHRNLARERLATVLNKFDIDKNDYFTVPVGSLIWATDDESDFDYQLVFESKEKLSQALNKLNQRRAEFDQELSSNKIHIIQGNFIYKSLYINPEMCASLLFTPDNFIGGNVALAASTRLQAVQTLMSNEQPAETWEKVVQPRFFFFFSHWDDLEHPLSQKYKRQTSKSRSRSKRIEARLEQRANQTKYPKRYKEVFMKAKNAITLPEVDVYASAIQKTKGELTIIERYSANGIIGQNEKSLRQKIAGWLKF